MPAPRDTVSVCLTTLTGEELSLEISQEERIGALRVRVAALLQKPRDQVAIVHGTRRIGPDMMKLEACGISSPSANITVLLTQCPVRVRIVTYVDGEHDFEMLPHDKIGVLREWVAKWLERDLDQVKLSYRDLRLEPDAVTLEDCGITASSIQVAAVLDDPPWQQMHTVELVAMMNTFGLLTDGELVEAERLVSEGLLSAKAARALFKPKLRTLAKEQVQSWKVEQWRKHGKARMQAAVSAQEELLARRSQAFDIAKSGRPSFSHVFNGRTSRALVGGGPTTETSLV